MLLKTDSGCANHSACKVVDDGLMTYPMYWASSVNDWYWASGDTEGFLRLAPDMGRIIDNAVEKFLQPGLAVAFFGWDDRIANGFCGSCNLEVQLGFAALTIRACGDFAASLAHAGDHANASRYNVTAARLAAQLRARPSKGGGPWHEDYGVHAAAYAINAKVLATPAEVDVLVSRELSDPVTVCSWSPFNNYWIVQALGNAGKMDQAAAFVKLCWGPMLRLGKGCFWELFSPEWETWMADGDKAPTSPSYCHPWASGVTHFLSNSMGGVRALEPGFKTYAAAPHVSAQTPEVRVTHPTPHGPISVAAQRDSRGVSVEVQSAVEGVVGLRTVEETTGCALDLSTVTGGLVANVDRSHPALDEQHVYVGVEAGRSVVSARFQAGCEVGMEERPTTERKKGLPTIPPFPTPSYPASWTLDNITGGDWVGKYGKEGYALFAFDEGSSLIQLPSFVRGLTVGAKGNNEAGVKSKWVGRADKNAAFLSDPRPAHKHERSLGWTSNTGNYFGADGSQGTVLNVNTTAGTRYRLSLYLVSGIQPNASTAAAACPTVGMVSSPCSATKEAIRVMDLETLNPIAPEPLLEDAAGGGLYWTLTYDRGVRLRVMPIDGDSGFCAVFFDEA